MALGSARLAAQNLRGTDVSKRGWETQVEGGMRLELQEDACISCKDSACKERLRKFDDEICPGERTLAGLERTAKMSICVSGRPN